MSDSQLFTDKSRIPKKKRISQKRLAITSTTFLQVVLIATVTFLDYEEDVIVSAGCVGFMELKYSALQRPSYYQFQFDTKIDLI